MTASVYDALRRLDVPNSRGLPLQLTFVGGLLLSAGAIIVPFSIAALFWVAVVGLSMLASERGFTDAVVPLPMLIAIVWIYGSYTWSSDPLASYTSLYEATPPLVGVLLGAMTLPPERLKKALVWFAYAVYWISLVFVLIDPNARTGATEASDTLPGWKGGFTHKNSLAVFLVIGLAILVTLAPPGTWRRLTFAVGAVLFAGVQSATALIVGMAVAGAAMWIVVLRQDARRIRAGAVALAFSGVLAMAGVILFLFAPLLALYGKDPTLTGRTDIWRGVLSIIGDRPIAGYGIGAVFTEPPSAAQAEISREAGFDVPHSHNGVLDVILHFGGIGLVLLGLGYTITVIAAWRHRENDPEAARAIMVISFALVMLSLSEAVFTGPAVLGLALTMQILAFRMVVARRTPAREDEPLRPALSRTVRSRPASAPGPAAR